MATFRTSGNVVFSGKGSAKTLITKIEKALDDTLGFEVPVMLRTEKQLAAIASAKPFPPKDVEKSKGKLQVALLQSKLGKTALAKIEELASDEDRLAADGTELYWLPEAGTADSPMGMKAIDKAAGMNTIRTMGTIEQIHSKFFG